MNTINSEIELINQLLKEVIYLCNEDFLRAGKILKAYSDAFPDQINQSHPDTSDLIKKFQFTDAFSQRMSHVVELNNASLDNNNSHTFSPGILIVINRLQVLLAKNDYAFTINELKKGIHNLYINMLSKLGIQFDESLYFARFDHIVEKLEYSLSEYERLKKICVKDLKNPLIQHSDLSVFNNLYTTTNERFVPEWLSKNDFEKTDELIRSYESEYRQREPEDIELF